MGFDIFFLYVSRVKSLHVADNASANAAISSVDVDEVGIRIDANPIEWKLLDVFDEFTE